MSIAVVIVAAGRGRRLGGETPKQYLPLGASTAIRLSIEAFLSLSEVEHVVPVIHADDAGLCQSALSGIDDPRLLSPVEGADTRALSVRNGLEALAPHRPEKVLIHDAARPFVTRDTIRAVIAALDDVDAVCAALPVSDTIWSVGENGAPHLVPRETLWRAQTPQGFRYSRILAAHRDHGGNATDDIAVAVDAGLDVRFVSGAEQAYKITTAEDYDRACRDVMALRSTGYDTGGEGVA